jgi:hypothetical protein
LSIHSSSIKSLTLNDILATLLPVEAADCDVIAHFKNAAILNVISAAFRTRVAPTNAYGKVGQHGKTLDIAVCSLHEACFRTDTEIYSWVRQVAPDDA